MPCSAQGKGRGGTDVLQVGADRQLISLPSVGLVIDDTSGYLTGNHGCLFWMLADGQIGSCQQCAQTRASNRAAPMPARRPQRFHDSNVPSISWRVVYQQDGRLADEQTKEGAG